MKKNFLLIFLSFLLILTLFAATSIPFKNKVEISGKLSEGNNYTTVSKSLSIFNNNDKNKLLRWGISRNPNNMPPDPDPGTPSLIEKYDGIYIGDTSKKEIYLTFDEGYENGYTAKILDILKENNVKALFFITGPYLKSEETLVKRMVEEGHEVGNHTVRHKSMPSLSDKDVEEEILGLNKPFYEKFNKNMIYFRPPMGEYSERTLEISKNLGFKNVFWSFAYDDWYKDKIRGADYSYDIVMRNLHNGAILLLHAVSKDNTEALDKIIKSTRERGYEFGDVSNL